MVNTGNDGGPWLRPILRPSEHEARVARGDVFERGGCVVQADRKLSEIVHRRPPGITAHQWSSAIRTRFDSLVCDDRTYIPRFAVEFEDPIQPTADAQRTDRMKKAVCEAVGLELLRIESSALRARSHGRRIVEYVIDARTFMDAMPDQEETAGLLPDEPLSYRDIVGRLPDGRSGYVNDLGAVARAAAVDAYVNGYLVDPIIRGLQVCWKNGPAEGWGWLEVRDGLFIFERTRIWQERFFCGIAPGRLAEDLAAAAIGERLIMLATAEPTLRGKDQLRRDFDELRLRRDDMETAFAFDHLAFF
jgi:hypothetical protein